MRLLKALSLFAALALLGGAVLDAQTGLVRTALGAGTDAGTVKFMPATKAAPLIHRPPPQQAAAVDGGK
jgi:hypothetical protein